MKKLLILLLTLLLVFSLAACGGGDKSDSKDNNDSSTLEESSSEDEPTSEGDDEGGAADETKAADGAEVIKYINVKMPEGWQYLDEGNASQITISEIADSDHRIKFSRNSTSLQETYDKALATATADKPREDLGDMTFGGYTYKSQSFIWNGEPSIVLYIENQFEEGKSITVNFFEIAPDHPIIAELLNNVTYIEY